MDEAPRYSLKLGQRLKIRGKELLDARDGNMSDMLRVERKYRQWLRPQNIVGTDAILLLCPRLWVAHWFWANVEFVNLTRNISS